MELQKLVESKDIFLSKDILLPMFSVNKELTRNSTGKKIIYSGKRKDYNPVHTVLVGHTEESKKEALIRREKEYFYRYIRGEAVVTIELYYKH